MLSGKNPKDACEREIIIIIIFKFTPKLSHGLITNTLNFYFEIRIIIDIFTCFAIFLLINVSMQALFRLNIIFFII